MNQYQVGVTVELCDDGLTKQVFFAPYYTLSNMSPFNIEMRLVRDTRSPLTEEFPWISVNTETSVPIWPQNDRNYVIFRIMNTKEETLPLCLEPNDEQKSTLLRLDNIYGGLFIEFQSTELSTVVTCRAYEEGRVPLLLVNNTCHSIFINEPDDGTLTPIELNSHQGVYYTWRQPNGTRRLKWSINNNQIVNQESNDVMQDDSGSFMLDEMGETAVNVYWKSFKHGEQRVLLFTVDRKYMIDREKVICDQIKTRITMRLLGLGMSFVDNVKGYEILYLGIASQPAIWEEAKKKKNSSILHFHSMENQKQAILEAAFKKYLRLEEISRETTSSQNGRRELDGGKLVVNFAEMIMYKPRRRHIRRSCRSGIELLYLQYSNRRKVYAKFDNLQVDNKLEDCHYPVILTPSSLPRELGIKRLKKRNCFADLQIIWSQRVVESVDIQIRPFNLCLEYNLILEMWDLLFLNDGINNHKNFYAEMKSAIRGTSKYHLTYQLNLMRKFV